MAVAINYLSLFAGHGGLDLGFRLGCEALGIVARCVGYVEREAYAAAGLLARMEDNALEPAPVWCGDICELVGREFRGIDNLWVIGGFPCQDISTAGKGAGIVKGNRSGLWFEYARIVEESGAVGVFAENVAAITRNGLDIVLQDLARLGFDAEWDCFTAAQVGAPHKRERWFCLARPPQRGQRERRQSPAGDGQPDGGGQEPMDDTTGARRDGAGQRPEAMQRSGERLSGAGRDAMAYAQDANGWQGEQGEQGRGRDRLADGSRSVGYADKPRLQGRPDERRCADERLPFPPGPAQRDQWGRILRSAPHLAPAVEPGLCVLVDELALVVDAARADQLRGCGNGVVPLQAAFAFVSLARRSGLAVGAGASPR